MKRTYSLNENQESILKLLYKFRFATSKQLAKQRKVTRSTINESLKVLMERELIGRRFDNTFKLQGKSARYYLAREGIKYLREKYKLSERMLRIYYRNKSVSDIFIDHNIAVLKAYQNLHRQYPGQFDVFTKAELATFDYFPEKLPDLYLSRRDESDNLEIEYMLDLFEVSQFFIIKKRIQEHIQHFDSGEWEDEQYPTVLIVCPDSNTETKVMKFIEPLLEDVDFLVTTANALLSENSSKEIWTDPVEPDKLLAL